MPLDTQILVREASRLAPLPPAVVRLVVVLNRDDWDPAEVLDVVRHDPVLTGKVLGAANSAAAGARRKILDVGEAVRRVGPQAVVGLALAAGAKSRMWEALPQFRLGEGELWRHSVAALLAAEISSAHFRIPFSTAAVTAALLHDVGKVLMARHLDPDTLDYLRMAQLEDGRTARGAEREVLHLSHAELGALVAAHWGLPEEIACAVRHHDDLDHAPAASRRDAALVQLADSVAKEVAPPVIESDDDPEERGQALAALGLAAASVDAFRAAVEVRFGEVGAAY